MISIYTHRHGDYADVGSDERVHRLPEVAEDRLASPSYAVTPYWWVPEEDVAVRTESKTRWRLAWRDVTDARASIRTVIVAVIPHSGVGNSLSIMTLREPVLVTGLIACLSSFALDYCARQKIAGLHLNFVQMKQLPVLPPSALNARCEWQPGRAVEFVAPRVLELTYTAWDLEPFAQDLGYNGPPFRWDPARRALLRAELDAAFFHLYGISRDDTAYILDTFPIVRKNDEKTHGEYRTKRLILEVYDAMADATRTGTAYVTRLDPPPADPRVAHPATLRSAGKN